MCLRILGIDPGYAIVGFGLVESGGGKQRLLSCGAINTPAGLRLSARLLQIANDLEELLFKFKPDALAIEELFFANNQKTVINVAQARGVILLAAQERGIPIFEYTPLQVKQSVVGYGRAEKRQVMEMVKILFHLPGVPRPDDAADALAIALTHGYRSSS